VRVKQQKDIYTNGDRKLRKREDGHNQGRERECSSPDVALSVYSSVYHAKLPRQHTYNSNCLCVWLPSSFFHSSFRKNKKNPF